MAQNMQDPKVGVRLAADGSDVQLRSARTGELAVTKAHGEYYEAAGRGNCWTVSSAAAGVVATAAVVIGVSAARPIVGLFNPTSNINCHITRAVIVQVSGTAVTGGFVWGSVSNPTAITGTGVSAINNKTFTKGGHTAYAFDGSTIVTGITTTVAFRYIAGFFPGAMTAGQTATFEEVEEDIVVGPGAFLGIFYVAAGTNTTAAGSLSWEEVPA